MRLSPVRAILWGLVAAAAIGAAGLMIWQRSAIEAVGSFGGGNYHLIDQRGAPVDQTMFAGHPSLLFFGYTHCPDVCPTTMAEMYTWFETLGEDARDLKAYFVSVDPERDTPAVLDQYVSWVSGRITGITGTPEEIDKIRRAWRVVADRVPGTDGGYTINHTASVYLLDSSGRFEGTISYGEDATSAVAKIRRLLAG